MLKLIYLIRNLTRNPLRTLLTCAAVALPVTIYVLSTAVIDGINRFLDNSAKQLRLTVTHKASIVNPLPSGYRLKIESLDPTRTRITSVCGFRYIGGRVENRQQPLSTIGGDVDSFLPTFPEVRLTPEQEAQWYRDRRAIILGGATATQFGWNVGDRITIRPTLPPYTPMEFNVVAAGAHQSDPVTNFCRRDYVEEEMKAWGVSEDVVGFLFVKCATHADLEYFRTAIDRLFAGSPDETRTQDEKSFMNEFITQQFNLPRNLAILAWVTIFVAVMAAANTMSMNFRDRLHEFASLKALGFGGGLIFGMIQAESLFLCGIGGAAGALGPYVAFTHTPLRNYTVPLIQTLEVQPVVCAQAMGISLLIGAAAALWPSWLALRLNVVNSLRSLE
jgi:putative ABC transport system permease protein